MQSRQRPALPLPSLRLKEQRSRQPLGKTDGRRLSADSVRASIPPIRREGKSPSVRSYIPLHARRRAAVHLSFTAFPMRVPADTRPAAPSQRRRKRKEVRRFPPTALPMESDLPQYPFCSTPYTACSWVKPSNSSWSISPSQEKGRSADSFPPFSGLLVQSTPQCSTAKTASSSVYFSNSSCLTKPS